MPASGEATKAACKFRSGSPENVMVAWRCPETAAAIRTRIAGWAFIGPHWAQSNGRHWLSLAARAHHWVLRIRLPCPMICCHVHAPCTIITRPIRCRHRRLPAVSDNPRIPPPSVTKHLEMPAECDRTEVLDVSSRQGRPRCLFASISRVHWSPEIRESPDGLLECLLIPSSRRRPTFHG